MSSPSSAPHIFTLTGNLLAERTLEFDTWSPGKTQRARSESFQVGGKGINVTKMLVRLGTPTTALCFTGGVSGAECEAWLRARSFPYHAFASATPTRTGTVVHDRSATHHETTFLGADAAPDSSAVRACAEFLNAQPAGQVLALCGSFPGWTSADFDPLRAALTRWIARGHLVVDTYGPSLTWAAAQPLALVKINADELRAFAADLSHLPASATALRWVVSDGPRAIAVRDTSGALSCFTPPVVREVSATGSGDVFLACILSAFFVLKLPLHEAVSFALPYAAANAAHLGVAEFPEPVS